MRWVLLFGTLTLFAALPIYAQDSDTFPRAGSLRNELVNLRAGPGKAYPIVRVFHRKGWPVSIMARYQNFYKIQDIEGEEGWVYMGMVSSAPTAIVKTLEPTLLYRRPSLERPKARVAQNVVVYIQDQCTPSVCRVKVERESGYIAKTDLAFPNNE